MWTLDGKRSRLSTSRFSANVSLDQPLAGLQDVQFDGQDVAATRLLSIAAADPAAGNAAALIDQYVRGSDLVATYDETAPLPVKSQIYWRTFEMGQTSLVGVELILSMQTSLLDSDPGMVVSSELPAAEVLHLANISPLEVVSVERQVSRIDSRTSSGLVIVRLPDCGVSWIQMVYPNDFLTVEVQVDPSGIATVSHRLFSERLEKGVIRRGRLRGILVPQADDVAIALECYAKLGSSLPPLTV